MASLFHKESKNIFIDVLLKVISTNDYLRIYSFILEENKINSKFK